MTLDCLSLWVALQTTIHINNSKRSNTNTGKTAILILKFKINYRIQYSSTSNTKGFALNINQNDVISTKNSWKLTANK